MVYNIKQVDMGMYFKEVRVMFKSVDNLVLINRAERHIIHGDR